MAMKAKTVVGSFDTHVDAHDAVERLVREGFDRNQISMLVSDESRGRHFGDMKGMGDRALEGAGAGAALGGVFGAIVAALAAVGSIVAPGVGLLVAGPLAAALAGAGAGGATGGIVGALIGAGMSESDASLIEKRLQSGAIVIAVHTPEERVALAKRVLKQYGGEKVAAASTTTTTTPRR
jgi:hypothetical protein